MSDVNFNDSRGVHAASLHAFRKAMDEFGGAFVDAFAPLMGYPTREECEQQRRIDRHMARCARRRKRRRKRR